MVFDVMLTGLGGRGRILTAATALPASGLLDVFSPVLLSLIPIKRIEASQRIASDERLFFTVIIGIVLSLDGRFFMVG